MHMYSQILDTIILTKVGSCDDTVLLTFVFIVQVTMGLSLSLTAGDAFHNVNAPC